MEEEEMSGSESDMQVMSEVHLGCPPYLSGPHISHFTFPCPPDGNRRRYDDYSTCEKISLDEDGDLVLTRRQMLQRSLILLGIQNYEEPSNNCRLIIQHNITSSIPSVGLQVWRAELLLADFVLHTMSTSAEFDGVVALELGAGTGMLGIVLASVAKTVFLTDHGDDVLNNCAMNVHLNSEMFKDRQTSVYVRELDWSNSWPPTTIPNDLTSQKSGKYSWIPSEVEEVDKASVLLAADVIYSDDLTDAFFNTIKSLMSRGSEKVLFLALEKRYNFSLSEFDVVANGYSHFRNYLKDEHECKQLGDESVPCFVGQRIDLAEIPQYVREYNRENNVEIWQIKYISCKSST